jgi:hypothetical protein
MVSLALASQMDFTRNIEYQTMNVLSPGKPLEDMSEITLGQRVTHHRNESFLYLDFEGDPVNIALQL